MLEWDSILIEKSKKSFEVVTISDAAREAFRIPEKSIRSSIRNVSY